MKKTFLLTPILFIASFSFADQNIPAQAKVADLQQPESNILVSVRPEILGLWGMKIPKNKCTEYYNFRSNNELVVKSGDEWSVGLFEYQPSIPSSSEQSPGLILQIVYDNNEKDCSGNQIDQSGELSQFYVKWDNPNQINFCSIENGGECIAKLNRILP